VIILDVDKGLYIGVFFALLLIIFRSQRPRASIIGNLPNTNIYECIETFPQAQEFEGIKIIRFEESIYYANVDNFKYKVMKIVGINPRQTSDILKKIAKKYEKLEAIVSENKIKLKKIE
jgi:MFS superfamily sulfate permease-like transporter